MKRILAASAVLVLAGLGSGCGLKGKLERPAPMWGSERARYLEEQRLAQEAAATKKAPRPRVDIPVEGEASSTPQTATTTPPATATEPSSPVKPDVSKSGGAVPPVQGITNSPYSNY